MADSFDPRTRGAKCDECPLIDVTPIKPRIQRRATLVIIGEAPGRDEEIEKQFFIGRSGAMVDAALDHFDIPKHKIHLTNALLCRAPYKFSAGDFKQAVLCCRPRLRKELGQTGASHILAYGAKAMLAVTGKAKIFEWIGAPLKGGRFDDKGRKWKKLKTKKTKPRIDFSRFTILPSLHPAFCLREPAWTPVLTIHTGRAWDIATGEIGAWEWPRTLVDDGPELRKGLREMLRLAKREAIGVDLETASIEPTSEILNIGFALRKLAISVQWQICSKETRILTRRLLKLARHQTYQFGQFDLSVLLAQGFEVNLDFYDFDTLLYHAVIAPEIRHALAIQCAIEFHAPRWKDEFRVSKDVAAADRFLKADPTERAVYNARDAWMTVLLRYVYEIRIKDTHNGTHLAGEYMELMKIAIKMRMNGIQIDDTKFARHRRNLRSRVTRSLNNIVAIAAAFKLPNFNPNAHQQVKDLFIGELGVKPSKFSKKTGLPSFDASALLKVAAHPNEIVSKAARSLLAYRRWKKLLGYIDLPMDEFQICHPTWNVQGARTGRWSCVAGDTLLETSRGTFRIDFYQPQKGDKIRTHKGRWRQIKRKYMKGIATMYRVHLESGESIKCTANHKFLTPFGWKKLGGMYVGMEVYCVGEHAPTKRSEDNGISESSLSARRSETGNASDSYKAQNNVTHRDGDSETRRRSQADESRESPSLFAEQDWEKQPLVWERETEKGTFGRPRISSEGSSPKALFCTSDSDGESVGDSSREITAKVGYPSCGRQSAKQQTGQSSSVYESRPQTVTPQARQINRITSLGSMVVYDIEVEEDHSYWAHGFCNHNSEDPNVMNIPKPRWG